MITIVLLGCESLISLRCAMLSAAGATKARKSEGVIHDGTARTSIIMPSESRRIVGSDPATVGLVDGVDVEATACAYGVFGTSRNRCTTPSGRLTEPDLDLGGFGLKVAVAGPGMIVGQYSSKGQYSDDEKCW